MLRTETRRLLIERLAVEDATPRQLHNYMVRVYPMEKTSMMTALHRMKRDGIVESVPFRGWDGSQVKYTLTPYGRTLAGRARCPHCGGEL